MGFNLNKIGDKLRADANKLVDKKMRAMAEEKLLEQVKNVKKPCDCAEPFIITSERHGNDITYNGSLCCDNYKNAVIISKKLD